MADTLKGKYGKYFAEMAQVSHAAEKIDETKIYEEANLATRKYMNIILDDNFLPDSGLINPENFNPFLYCADKESSDFNITKWEEEVIKRGLSNKKNTVDAIECLKDKKLTQMLIEESVFSQTEIDSRYEILLDGYCNTIRVEALTALKMAENNSSSCCF